MALLTPTRALKPLARFAPFAALESLVTPHGLDRYLELVNPMLTVREMRARVTAVHRSTEHSVTLTLRPTRQWRGFRAGQYVQVHVDIDGVRHTRCYSPACSQHRADGQFELTVKAHPEGVVSNYLHRFAYAGMVIGVSPADGVFTLPTPRPQRTLLISGGSGITPVLSMLRTLVDEGHAGEIVFLHYAFTQADVAHLSELQAIAAQHDNVRLVLAYTESPHGADLHGLFDPSHLDAVAPWYRDAETFLCGPPGLMNTIREHFAAVRAADRLHVEEFTLATVPADAEATGALTFTRSGSSADNDGSSILEQAEAAGLTPEHGCRMGICFTCTAVKTSGCTRDLRTGELNADPDREIQLCISAPVGDVAIDL